MTREHGRVYLFAAVMVCFAVVRWWLGYVADHGVNGLGVAVRFSYEESRALSRWGDVAGVVAIGSGCLCLRAAVMGLAWMECGRDCWCLAVAVMLVLLTGVFGVYG
jgi:hypothetical protein